jgi:2,3,4,5-tetrahydropyridine-2-carboxylate N-succinyltransferase
VAEEGGAAVVPPQRHERDFRRPRQASWWDKVPSKFDGWGENRFRDAGFRAVPGAIVRRSAFIARNVVLMPSFVNLGAYVDEAP